MRFEKVRDVLDHANNFHQQASEYYRQLADQVTSPRVKMMLDYLSDHEKTLRHGLQEYQENASANLLDTWLQFTHDESTLSALSDATQAGAGMTLDDVVDLAMKVDRCLIELYREMASSTDSKEVTELFLNFIELGKQEMLQMARNAAMAQDL